MKQIQKFVCLLGLPRSGTTLATAILDAHPAVELFYEPWNSSKKNPPPIYENPSIFKNRMRERTSSKSKNFINKIKWLFSFKPGPDISVVGFKETSLHPEALEWSRLTMEKMAQHCECQLLIIIRDHMHAYLSKVEGARKYWDHPDVKLTEDGYQEFVRQAIRSYRFMGDLSKSFRTIVFDYDALVTAPENIVPTLMEFIGLNYESNQLSYYTNGRKGFRPWKIMGDPGFVTKSKDGIGIFNDSIMIRQNEAEEFRKQWKSKFWQETEIQLLDDWVNNIKNKKIVSSQDITWFGF